MLIPRYHRAVLWYLLTGEGNPWAYGALLALCHAFLSPSFTSASKSAHDLASDVVVASSSSGHHSNVVSALVSAFPRREDNSLGET